MGYRVRYEWNGTTDRRRYWSDLVLKARKTDFSVSGTLSAIAAQFIVGPAILRAAISFNYYLQAMLLDDCGTATLLNTQEDDWTNMEELSEQTTENNWLSDGYFFPFFIRRFSDKSYRHLMEPKKKNFELQSLIFKLEYYLW